MTSVRLPVVILCPRSSRSIAASFATRIFPGVSTLAVSPSSPDNNKVSVEDESGSLESRNDHPDLDDLSSFFDFELAPPNRNYQDPSQRPTRHKYYYYYRPGGPMYPEHQYVPPQKQVVTPGSHYKDQDSNDTKSNSKKAVIGSYQVSVVDADSPVLSDLGLSKDDLEKLSSYTRRSSNGSMLGSDSVQTATYAEHPRQDYPHSNAPENHYESKHHQYGSGGQYKPSEYGGGGQYRPSEYYPADGPPPHRGYGHHPPPQGSYDAKSYERVQSSPSSGYSSSQHSHHHHHPPSSYPPKRTSGEQWRATSQSHTDWDDKHGKKQEGYHPHGSYQPPPPHSSAQSTSPHHPPPAYHPRPTYSSTDKPGYRYPTYKYPTSQKPTYGSSASSEYHSHKSSSSHYPPSSHHPKAPSRAGSYPHEGEASKPGITIRFKAKTPGGGLNIPVNFNPLDVVKKLIPLSALNPLNNKKVTIGITIENKKEGEHHAY